MTKTQTKTHNSQVFKSLGLATGLSLWMVVIGGAFAATYHYYTDCSITVKPSCLLK